MVQGGSSKCNPGKVILSVILMAVGALVGVQGFVMQLGLDGAWDTNAMGWIIGYYFVGILLIGVGKMMKCKCGMCSGKC